MTVSTDLIDEVASIAVAPWQITQGRVVPDLDGLTRGNVGKLISACILYADLSKSTEMVGRVRREVAASYYKAFLSAAAKLIRHNGGEIRAYDGDRVMGIFIGDGKEDRAVRCGLNLKHIMDMIVNPTFAAVWSDHQPLLYTVGIDTGEVLACKAGVRNDSDLVWIGDAANYAAKLNSFSGLDHEFPMRITSRVHALLSPQSVGATLLSLGPEWSGPYGNIGVGHYRTSSSSSLGL
ncbi:adenylate/guanylate cyclase domain-containing protein [Luteimonas sp BLCC-B24]|uniref:adenylate/guanylate cyclase domain-containing protein n=1 Tax=Luteimonas sp. BLCC-B24 TaxID=3025317 RepID=UPI00234CA809|nr:adenylate/guanylate cyclase domain-containing protein [Luteimonas sp. BLCC-B24]MDC7806380.1 adenylate/guanylate cyclase domain-containing protein [Luteimonas sp. BLCC-B24]